MTTVPTSSRLPTRQTNQKLYIARNVTMPKLPKVYKKAVVFGVFDQLHDGHRSFLKQAVSIAHTCTVVVARDHIVLELKKRLPLQDEKTRLRHVLAVGDVRDAILGDSELGLYEVVRTLAPDVICLGYDQEELERDLAAKMQEGILPRVPLQRLAPHPPEQFHTSVLHSNIETA